MVRVERAASILAVEVKAPRVSSRAHRDQGLVVERRNRSRDSSTLEPDKYYEKELTKKPNLRGKVTSRFIIAGTGRVQMAKVYQTTMGYAPTEKCIIRIIKMMRFPQPRGGGIVSVTYPFMFQKAGR